MTLGVEDRRARWVEAALAHLDDGDLAATCVALVDVPSPTGDEAALATVLADRMRAGAGDGHLQPLDDRQANAWGRLRGDGTGPTLMLYAPIDTLTVGTPDEDLPWVGDELRPHMVPRATIAGGQVSGLGAMNPKGHAACVLAAWEAIHRAGVPLRGDVVAAFGAGGMPTNARPGPRRHTGQGVGASFLLEQGVWADAAVIAKTGWAIAWEEVGLAWCDVTVRGTHTYVGARHRLPYRNAIDGASRLVRHLEDWFPGYGRRHRTELCEPQGIVAAMEAGWWRMAAVTPAQARFRVDLRLAPGQSPLDAKRELEAAVAACAAEVPGLDATVELALAIPGSRTDPGHWVCRRAIAAWEAVAGRPHEPITATSGATDANILRNRGIPTVRVGLPKVRRHGVEVDFAAGMNTVEVSALRTLTRFLIRVAVDVATTERAELEGVR
jgi:acetylornithine deacetylase/succinyl-diaminopimelate desuccinylase-like protein